MVIVVVVVVVVIMVIVMLMVVVMMEVGVVVVTNGKQTQRMCTERTNAVAQQLGLVHTVGRQHQSAALALLRAKCVQGSRGGRHLDSD